MRERRALRQFTLSTGKSAGRNSSGRITLFHRGGGSKRLQRRIDLKRSTSSMGIVERIEYDPNRSSRIAPVRWSRDQRKCKTIEEFAPPKKRRASTTTTIRGPFAFSSMPSWWKSHFTSKGAGSKKTCTKDVFFSAFSSPKAKGASLSFGSSFSFPRIAVAGALPAFFVFRMREQVRGKNTFSLCEIRKWRTHSILWAHRIKRKAALSWQSRKDLLGLVGASEHSESKPKTDQGQLHSAKAIDEGPKNGTCKVDRAPVTYIIASHQLEAGKMVMNWSKPSTYCDPPRMPIHTLTLFIQRRKAEWKRAAYSIRRIKAASWPRPPAYRYERLYLNSQIGNIIPFTDYTYMNMGT